MIRMRLFAAVLLGLSASALAAPVTVLNAGFSTAANDGSIGGSLVGGAAAQSIGSGPWEGTYAGVLGVLLPPVLTIAPDQATISGLAVQVLGLANQGAFAQTLTTTWAPIRHYVLEADVSAGTSVLALNVLTGGNIGLALDAGTARLSSSQTSALISLTLAQDNSYHIAVGYDSQGGDSGDIGVELFSHPTGVLSANVFSTVTFDNIELTSAPIPALSAYSLGPVGGTPQAATVLTEFSAPLTVRVIDAEGDPLQNVMVTFSAPASGPSATLSATTAMTDISGRATVTGTANNIVGTYPVMATVGGVALPATFNLTNSGSGQPTITSRAGGDQHQSTATGNVFACMLSVQVINGSSPAAGATVMFSAPLSGASATLDDGTTSGAMLVETTDANGVAAVSATANATAGSYDVTAMLTALQSGSITPQQLAVYPLTNLDGADELFADGFETTPARCGSF
jgi:hypothetical protein